MTAQSRQALGQNAAITSRPRKIQRGILWAADLTRHKAKPISARVPAEFKPIERQQLPQLLATAAQMDSISPDALLRRFNLGRQCYTAWVGDSIAAYGWLTRGREWVGEFERALNLRDDEAYIWDCATLPNYRHQRLFSALIGNIGQHLGQQGVRRLWIIAVVTTPSMNRGIADAGFEPMLRLTYFHVYNKRILLTLPASSPQSVSPAYQLLVQHREHRFGPLLVSNAPKNRPPDTHTNR